MCPARRMHAFSPYGTDSHEGHHTHMLGVDWDAIGLGAWQRQTRIAPSCKGLADLPTDLLVAILVCLDVNSLGRTVRVCRALYAADSSELWERVARATKLETKLMEPLGLSWKALCVLDASSKPRAASAVSMHAINDEYEFFAEVFGDVSGDGDDPTPTRSYIVSMQLTGIESEISLSTPDDWAGPPDVHWDMVLAANIYVRNKSKKMVTMLLELDVHDGEVEDCVFYVWGSCRFVHRSHGRGSSVDEVGVVVVVSHELGHRTKWKQIALTNFNTTEDRDFSMPFTLSDFAEKLTSKSVRWTQCTM